MDLSSSSSSTSQNIRCVHDYGYDRYFAFIKENTILKGALINTELPNTIKRKNNFQLTKNYKAKNISQVCEIVLGFLPFEHEMDRYIYPVSHT